MTSANDRSRPPVTARALGYAGLLPQAWALTVVIGGAPEARFSALSLGYAYAALIVSFLGGMWWGLAARAHEDTDGWVWAAAVTPSLIALASALPWAIGTPWPGPSLMLLGVVLLTSVAVDYWLASKGLCPKWWIALRLPLSIGLGTLTLMLGVFA